MSDHAEILPEVRGERGGVQGRSGDAMETMDGVGTHAAFDDATSMYGVGAHTVQGRLKSPVAEDQASVGGGEDAAKDTFRRAELAGAGEQFSNDLMASIEAYPAQETQTYYSSNVPNGSNKHETPGGVAEGTDTGGKGEGRGHDGAAATATTGARPGSDAGASRRSVRRLSSRSNAVDEDSAGGPTRAAANLASSEHGGRTTGVQVEGANNSSAVSCSFFVRIYARLAAFPPAPSFSCYYAVANGFSSHPLLLRSLSVLYPFYF